MVGHLVATLVASMWLGQLEQEGRGGCEKDNDCKGDRICVAHECRSPEAPHQQAAPRPVRADERLAEVQNSLVGIQLDLGGFLFLGPSIDVEIGKKVAFFIDARAIGLGLVMDLVIAGTTSGERNSTSLGSFGLGAGGRYYFGDRANRQGLYLGGLVEFVSVHTRPPTVSFDYGTLGLFTGANVGYRWVFPNRLTLGVGGFAGALIVLDASTTYTGTGLAPSGYSNGAATSPGGFVTLELGFDL